MSFHVWLIIPVLIGEITGQACSNGRPIPAGYTKFAGQYYKLHDDILPYVDSMKKCSEEGAHLPRFKTEVDFNDIAALRAKSKEEIWMDLFNIKLLHNKPYDGQLYWGDGDVFTEEPWMNGFDVNDPAVCMRMARVNGYTGDRPCTGPFQTLCQWDCEDQAISLTSCPGGDEMPSFYNYFGSLYKFLSTPNTWAEQRRACQAEQGDMVTFKTAKEYIALLQFQGTFATPFFVGLQNPEKQPCKVQSECNKLTWVDGTRFESLNFLPEVMLPNGMNEVDVAVVLGTSHNFEFHSDANMLPALCQVQCTRKCTSSPPSPSSHMVSNFGASTLPSTLGTQVTYVSL
ncbi:uncharacterized protein LOC131882128 isoform X2 [Tigriopus californicus]|uniref:uncharacterized protein LOC131882128 isoform X2 n=1 Tax=Tigriopus californicus TaxID=6832 RepID=UPI0027DA6DC8|nr:uncharacterized protein LOC131882128 isoform X2 [Tigriopus californicus]